MPKRGRRNADDVLLLSLACGATVDAAAAKAGVSSATVYRRLNEENFQLRLRDLRADMVQRTGGMLTAAAGEAVKTLLALQKETIASSTRLGAARAVLELGMKVREVAELEQRLVALEKRMGLGDDPARSQTD
jgi:hypothetical protein